MWETYIQKGNNSKFAISVDRIKKYFPSDYDPEGEYREAMELKYGNTN